MSNIYKFRKFHHWPFSNSQPKLNVTIFNRRHLLKRNYKYRSNPKMHTDFPEFSSSISYMCPGLFTSYSVGLSDSHYRSVRQEKQTSRAAFWRASVLQGEMEVQGSYMTCSNPTALRGRAGLYHAPLTLSRMVCLCIIMTCQCKDIKWKLLQVPYIGIRPSFLCLLLHVQGDFT